MKYLVLFFPLLFISIACHYTRGSGRIISEKRATGDFTGVSISGPFEVELRNGPSCEVIVESDDNIISYIETNVKRDLLTINTRKMGNYANATMRVFITAPLVTDISVSAAANLVSRDPLSAKELIRLNASSAGRISADINAPGVDAGASSGASVRLTGRTRSYKANASSGASLKTYDLLSENTRVTASSGGNAEVHASISLDASASSGGSVSYHGAASVQKSESSGGRVGKGEK